MREIDESDDIIDSRDVIERIAELEAIEQDDDETLDEWDTAELVKLRALAVQGESLQDWQYGETLIRDSYFVEYAEQLAEDIGAIGKDAGWPLMHIDWEAAAGALRMDYTSIEFAGVTYWAR